MAAFVAGLFFGAVFGAILCALVRRHYWLRAGKRWPMRVRYRRYHASKRGRVLSFSRRYYPSPYRMSRLLNRLADFDDSDLQR